jgi:hypothetical protein
MPCHNNTDAVCYEVHLTNPISDKYQTLKKLDTTVTILNWKRPENLIRHIIPALDSNPRIAEIFIVNNNCSDPGGIVAGGKVRIFDIGRDLGLDARFSVAHFAKTPLVFIQDDDLLVPPRAMDVLLDASLEDNRIHGIFGRRPTADNKYATFVDAENAEVGMVITRALACRRTAIAPFFSLRETEPIIQARARHKEFATHPENGEDIIFSYALRAANWGQPHRVHALTKNAINELPEYGVAQCQNPRFADHRTAIMRACQEATGIF